MPRHILADDAGEMNRDGVAKLAHRLRPRTMKQKIVREGLQAGALAHTEITDATVRQEQHVFAAGDAMNASLERLGGLIQRDSVWP
jgi:hypothetical protein